jgi:Armadillo/beta-catenin-like repeat
MMTTKVRFPTLPASAFLYMSISVFNIFVFFWSLSILIGFCAGMRWRDPNLTEVIGFLNNPNNVIKANAAAYLQHLCYMDDPNKQKTRALGGIPPLTKLLTNESPDVYRNACGALR